MLSFVRYLLPALALFLLGCPGNDCEAPAKPGVFELGTGEACFVRVSAGNILPIIYGSQGGQHVWTAFGCKDCPPTPVIHYGAKDPETGEWLYAGEVTQVVELAGDWPQVAGLRASLPDSWDENAVSVGSHVLLSLEVATAAGQVLHHQEVEVILGEGQP